MNRTRAYWPTRIILTLGLIATMAAVVFAFMVVTSPFPIDPTPDIVEPGHVVAVAAAGVAVLGLVWMVRIFRAPRDERPTWRYRER